MAREHVSHSEIAQFAKEKVNLPKVNTEYYRSKAIRIGEKIKF